MLELLKILLGITDTSQDDKLEFFLNKSKNTIKNYLNTDDTSEYEQQIVDLAMYYYRNKDYVGITQITQGSRGKTLKDGIPSQIKDTLPLPKVRFV